MDEAKPGEVGGDVLVVEDDQAGQHVLHRVVELAGGTPFVVGDGVQARAAAAERRFACALVDKNLPGENGLSLMRWLREAQPACPAMIITAYGNLDSAVEAIRLGAVDYVLKPYDVDSLAQKIRLMLERTHLLEERQRLRGLLLQRDRLASLGTVAAGVVHEINNALTYLTTSLRVVEHVLPKIKVGVARARAPELADVGQQLDTVERLVAEMNFGADQMALLARDVRAFSRAEEEAATRSDPREAAEAAVRMVWPQLRFRAVLVVDYGRVPAVPLSSSRLAQVFLNLLLNALQALPEGRPQEHEISLRLSTSASGEAIAEVADTGPGLAPEALPHLFEAHFTTKPRGEGSGLGLSICRSIVEGAGGGIEAVPRSGHGRGALFRVRLPGAPGGDLAPAGRPRVLLAIQESALAGTLRRLLWDRADLLSSSDPERALPRLADGPLAAFACELATDRAAAAVAAALERDPRLAAISHFVLAPSRALPPALVEQADRCLRRPFDEAALRAWLARVLG